MIDISLIQEGIKRGSRTKYLVSITDAATSFVLYKI